MDVLLFANSSNADLVWELLLQLKKNPTFSHSRLADVTLKFHADREPFVEIKNNVRRGRERRCIVVGCIASDDLGSVNDHAIETLVLLDALRRADAEIEALILPYLPYARQDRRKGEVTDRTAITAELFARLLNCTAPLRRVCAVEPHDVHIEGFFQCPFDRIPVLQVFVEPVLKIFTDPERICVVSPDRGGWERASAFATALQTPRPIAWIDKRRPRPGEAKAHQLVGEVKGLDVVLMDDLIDTAGSLCESAAILERHGAARTLACAVHGLFSDQAVERIEKSGIERIFVSSSVKQKPVVLANQRFQVIPLGDLLAQAIHRLLEGESLRSLGHPKT